jgi:hypothetical protein
VIISSTAYGQDSATKIDEVNYVNCEHQRSVIDNLLIVLKNSPDSNGLIIIHGTAVDPVFPYRQRQTISDHLKFRSKLGMSAANKVDVVLGENSERPNLELWKLPDEAMTEFVSRPWDHKLPQLKQPLLVQKETWSDAIGCDEYSPTLKFYSEFLIANEGLLGRIVIKDNSLPNYEKRKKAIIAEFVKKYKVRQEDLEFSFSKSDEKDVEYWYLTR